MEIASLLEWGQHWGLRQQPAGQALSSTDSVKDNSWNYLLLQRVTWVIESLIFFGTCNHCFIVHALTGCFHCNFHKPSTISEDRAFWKRDRTGQEIVFPSGPSEHSSARKEGIGNDLCILPSSQIQFQRGAASSGGTATFTWEGLCQSISSGVSLHKVIQFYNFFFLTWNEVLTMDTMTIFLKIRYFLVRIKGRIPDAAFFFLLSSCMHREL